MKRKMLCWMASAALCLPGMWLRADDEPKPDQPAAGAEGKPKIEFKVEEAKAEPGYWIGVIGEPLSPLLKSHLKLEAGVVVQHVMPESPAAKGGLKEHDILLKFGDKAVANLPALAEAVAAAKELETEVAILRAGERMAIKIKPEKRTEQELAARIEGGADAEKMLEAWRKMIEQGEGGEFPWRGLVLRPGMVLPKELPSGGWLPRVQVAPGLRSLPSGTAIMVEKEDDGPAKITVKRGDKTWTATEDKLNELPEDVRGPVTALLHGHGGIQVLGDEGLRVEVFPGNPPGAAPNPQGSPKVAPRLRRTEEVPPANRLEDFERRIREHEKELQKQLEELRKEIESLKKQ